MALSPRALTVALAAVAVAACSPTKKDECSSGQIICPTGCANPLTDPANCGTCMNACPATATCAGGTCACQNAGEVLCNGACVPATSFASDPQNCGACGVVCGFGSCAGGVCQCEGGTRCDGQSPRCAHTDTDPANCGGCGLACSKPGSTCVSSACTCAPSTPDDCGTFCTDWSTDRANCGTNASACGNACALANEICANGACTCPTDFPVACPTAAPTACVNTQTDKRNCGGCGIVCGKTNEICSTGTCACPANVPATCGNACVSLASDEQHCGDCTTACPTGGTCTDGLCNCPASQPDVCNKRCVDVNTDRANCGGCGNACPAVATCSAGHCACPAATPVQCSATLCCAGDACCGTGCQTAHANGLGGTYYDCGLLDQHTATQAHLAAASWMPTGTNLELVPNCGNPSCLCREGVAAGTTRTDAAVWCYQGSGPLSGFVVVTQGAHCPTAACPFASPPATAWH